MFSKVNVLLNDVGDVHLELEDDDHDVTHAVSSHLSFKVGMMERMCCWILLMSCMELRSLMKSKM